MIRSPVSVKSADYPAALRSYLDGAKLFDSSCSPFAEVIFIQKGEGYYLKKAKAGELKREAEMTGYYASLGLSARVVEYITEKGCDYMLTERIRGEDCTYFKYLEQPVRLCDTLATLLRQLHEREYTGCPIPDHTELYLKTAEENYKKGLFDPSYIMKELNIPDADSAYRYVNERRDMLKSDTLLHGDYCLPNVMLDDFAFSGFIDVGNGGVGDRHVDLFWGAWTLNFNLKTDRYRERFFDAYGRELVDRERLMLVSAVEAFG